MCVRKREREMDNYYNVIANQEREEEREEREREREREIERAVYT